MAETPLTPIPRQRAQLLDYGLDRGSEPFSVSAPATADCSVKREARARSPMWTAKATEDPYHAQHRR